MPVTTYAQVSERPAVSLGSRLCETLSTITPTRNAVLTTSAPTKGITASLDDSEGAAEASRPILSPVIKVILGSKQYSRAGILCRAGMETISSPLPKHGYRA